MYYTKNAYSRVSRTEAIGAQRANPDPVNRRKKVLDTRNPPMKYLIARLPRYAAPAYGVGRGNRLRLGRGNHLESKI